MNLNTFFGVVIALILGSLGVYVAVSNAQEQIAYEKAVNEGTFYNLVEEYYDECLSNFGSSDDVTIRQYCIKQAEELAKRNVAKVIRE